MCKIGKNRKAHVDFEFRPHFFQSTTKQYQEPPHKISFSLAKVLNLTNFGTNLSSRGAPTNLAKCKMHPIQNFCAPTLLQYSFGDLWRPFQPSHLKNHEFHFFTKLPTKPPSYAVVHRTTCQVQNPPNSKLSCTKTFMVFIWGHLEAFPTLTSQKPRISFFHKPRTKPNLVVMHRPTWLCAKPTELKTFVHQNFHGIHLRTFGGLSNHHISKTTNEYHKSLGARKF